MAAIREASDALSRAPTLDQACEQLGLDLSAAQKRRLLAFLDLMARWSATYNLTSIRDKSEMLTHHLYDCLAIVPALGRELAKQPARQLLDVGSGGGLPGVVIAVALPDVQITCVDAVRKKVAFVRQVGLELGLPNLSPVHGRIESLQLGPFNVIASRAYASLLETVKATQRLLAPGGRWLSMKGKTPDQEIAALPAGIEAFHVEHLVVPGVSADRCIIWMRAE